MAGSLSFDQGRMLRRLSSEPHVDVYGIRDSAERNALLALTRRGLAREIDRPSWGRRFEITDEGRTAFVTLPEKT